MAVHAFRIIGWAITALALAHCDKPQDRNDPPADAHKRSAARRTSSKPASPAQDWDQRLREARSQSSADQRNRALAAVLWEMAETEPTMARDSLHEIPAGSPERNSLIQHLSMRMAEQNPEEASRWAATLASDEDRSLAYGHIALVIAETDPAQAAQLLSDAGVLGRDFDVAAVQVVQRWAAKSPGDSATWVAQFDPSPLRHAALQSAINPWLQHDPRAAIQWIEALPDPDLRQEAVGIFIERAKQQPPGEVDEWLSWASPALRSQLDNEH